MAPAVDVVVPAYNPGPFLHHALRSVVCQSHNDWHCVVVDDGSTEDLRWVDTIDPRIRRIRQPNAGLSAARNRGIAEGRAPFVAFLDADDIWLPRKLERQLEALVDSQVTVCSTNFDMIDEHGEFAGDGFVGYAESRTELLQGNGICVSTVVVPRSHLERAGCFDQTLQQVQDWDLWLKLSRSGRPVKLVERLARYRVHGSNMSANYMNMLRESLTVLQRNADGDERKYAVVGQRRVRELAGTQAFDAFRATRDARHLVRAARLHPRYVLRSLAMKATPRLGSR